MSYKILVKSILVFVTKSIYVLKMPELWITVFNSAAIECENSVPKASVWNLNWYPCEWSYLNSSFNSVTYYFIPSSAPIPSVTNTIRILFYNFSVFISFISSLKPNSMFVSSPN